MLKNEGVYSSQVCMGSKNCIIVLSRWNPFILHGTVLKWSNNIPNKQVTKDEEYCFMGIELLFEFRKDEEYCFMGIE